MASQGESVLELRLGRKESSSSHRKAEKKMKCPYCLQKNNVRSMLSLHRCAHKFCVSCVNKHIKARLQEGTSLPACPHTGCKSRIRIRNCKKVLSSELVKLLRQRLKESRIPIQERIYCPYPTCSYLMSKEAILKQSKGGDRKGKKKKSDKSMYRRKCLKCGGKFCVECKVSWHDDITCSDYKKLHPYSCAEEEKLVNLAKKKLWIKCTKCGHLIERSSGCRNIKCRCGCKLCYSCGAEQEKGKRSCSSSCSEYSSDSGSSSDDSDTSSEIRRCDFADSDSDSCSSG